MKAKRVSVQSIQDLQARLGYEFTQQDRLEQALTHASAVPDKQTRSAAERLEFLGDRVLGLVIAQTLLERFPDEAEGALAQRLNGLVNGQTCSRMAYKISLDQHVITGSDQFLKRGQEAVLADTMEAVLGAMYLDGGIQAAQTFILSCWGEALSEQIAPPQPPKSALQEWAQARGQALPVYDLIKREGPDHAPIFTIRVRVSGHEAFVAKGHSRQEAESAAAAGLVAQIEAE